MNSILNPKVVFVGIIIIIFLVRFIINESSKENFTENNCGNTRIQWTNSESGVVHCIDSNCKSTNCPSGERPKYNRKDKTCNCIRTVGR